MSTKLRTQAKTTSPTLVLVAERPRLSQCESFRDGLPSLTDGFVKPGKNPLVSLSSLFQPKLTIGQPDDKYEQEADRVAEQVTHMSEPSVQRAPT
jgi:hypothetical protein